MGRPEADIEGGVGGIWEGAGVPPQNIFVFVYLGLNQTDWGGQFVSGFVFELLPASFFW